MTLLRVNADGPTPVAHSGCIDLRAALTDALATPGPITVMIHGLKFHPHDPIHCPHTHIFAAQDGYCDRAVSWPHKLGFLSSRRDCGVGIAYGWQSRGTFKQTLRAAQKAARALAHLVRQIRLIAPNRPVNFMGHSMGGYVALRALHLLGAGDIGRVILLNATVFRKSASKALRTPAGQRAELYNFVSGENAIYDFMYKRLIGRKDPVLGHGLVAPNALTLRLDDRRTLDRLLTVGFRVAPPAHWYCHWSTYLRPGVFHLYNALLHRPADLPLGYLQDRLADPMPARPRLRLLGHPMPLPLAAAPETRIIGQLKPERP